MYRRSLDAYGRQHLSRLLAIAFWVSLSLSAEQSHGQTKLLGQTNTWDGKHDTTNIQVTVVYFVPKDRKPLLDWHDRVSYYCDRIQRFHQREFQGQSSVTTSIHPSPVISKWTTAELRQGDADAIFFRTLQEVDQTLAFDSQSDNAFPILLTLSEINHRPLDDFYRLSLRDGVPTFEGILTGGHHFPGSKLGGARATYLADRGAGWGLVSADGWRVPYRGSDCVIYHEGLGHTVGLPHPEPANRSVMSLAQYHGWLNESWIDEDQKRRLGWKPSDVISDANSKLFDEFLAVPQPAQPLPGQPAKLKLTLPDSAKLKTLRVRFQTTIDGPWIEVKTAPSLNDSEVIDSKQDLSELVTLGTFDRPTPVSYRVDVATEDASAELWGYFQVRDADNQPPEPITFASELASSANLPTIGLADPPGNVLDLLSDLQLSECFTTGKWLREGNTVKSDNQYGARLELPDTPPPHYRMTVIAEPLDPPGALLLGLRKGDNRFVVLVNFTFQNAPKTALENVDGRNVGNQTTYAGALLKQNQLSQIIATVHPSGVQVTVDGRLVIDWKGSADQLSLSDYWTTPNNKSLFLGTYDCSYRFHRVTLEPL